MFPSKYTLRLACHALDGSIDVTGLPKIIKSSITYDSTCSYYDILCDCPLKDSLYHSTELGQHYHKSLVAMSRYYNGRVTKYGCLVPKSVDRKSAWSGVKTIGMMLSLNDELWQRRRWLAFLVFSSYKEPNSTNSSALNQVFAFSQFIL